MISNEGLITVLQRHGKWWDITIWCTVWQLHFHHSMRTCKLLGICRITWSCHNRLRVLEMFGCFNIKAKGISYLSANCINLKTLNLGQCYKVRFALSTTMLAVYDWVFIQSNCHPFEMRVHVHWSVSISHDGVQVLFYLVLCIDIGGRRNCVHFLTSLFTVDRLLDFTAFPESQ